MTSAKSFSALARKLLFPELRCEPALASGPGVGGDRASSGERVSTHLLPEMLSLSPSYLSTPNRCPLHVLYPYVQIHLHAYLPLQPVPCIHAAPDGRHFLITAIRTIPGTFPQQQSLIPLFMSLGLRWRTLLTQTAPEPPDSPRAG